MSYEEESSETLTTEDSNPNRVISMKIDKYFVEFQVNSALL